LFLFNNISMMIVPTEQRIAVKRHIGSARQKLYRARPSITHHENMSQRPQQTLPSPDILRARWIELLNGHNKM
jgi:hypothetical protein